jgi:hypothetical protein
MATPTPTTLPTEPIGSIPTPIDLIGRVAKADREVPTSRLSMKMPFDVRDRSFEPGKNWRSWCGETVNF